MSRKQIINYSIIALYTAALGLSFIFDFSFGKVVAGNFFSFTKDMIAIIPCAFILIGLFEVWVKRETVEKHLGEDTSLLGYLWVILLAGTTVGGLYVAFPVAYTLHRKGARLAVIFTYIGAAAICRIPMTVFEASFLGLRFTITRLLVSLPLVILSSLIFEKYLKNKGFQVKDGE